MEFNDFWQLLDKHGVIEYKKGEAAALWDSLSPEQQQQIAATIERKIANGKYVDYNPVRAIHDNIPKQRQMMLTMAEYHLRFGTTEERDGWHMVNPTGNKVMYVKQ